MYRPLPDYLIDPGIWPLDVDEPNWFDREAMITELAETKASPDNEEEWAEALFHYELLSDTELLEAHADLYR